MSDRRMHALSLALVAAAGMLAAGPAYACHLATGWCCNEIGTDYYCCYWKNDVLQESTCGWIDPQ
jgi:hypothetical protein